MTFRCRAAADAAPHAGPGDPNGPPPHTGPQHRQLHPGICVAPPTSRRSSLRETRARSLALVGEACVFCGGAPAREHVYPKWFLKLWDATGPFKVEINGEPLRSRHSGQPVTSAKMWRVMLPCCGICNGDLDRLFEKPANSNVRVLMRDVQPLDDQVAVLNAARWVVKTLALAAHPAANHTAFASRTEKDKKGRNTWEEYPRTVLDSIKVGDIPADMSLWVAVTDPSKPGLPDPPFEEVFLRRTSRADGRGGSGRRKQRGFGWRTVALRSFSSSITRCTIWKHPFEPDGLVTRLWPDPPVRFDVRGHPVLNYRTRLADVFADGLFDHGLELGERSVGNGPPWSDW